jgi:ribosomal protein S18 acetylase RimI-like enzyme
MNLRFDFLAEIPFGDIVAAFNRAFVDYALPMHDLSETWLRHRLLKNAVDYDVSVGAFAGDELVGFSLIGVDDWLGVSSAYDAATGIVREYRARHLARRMFDFARPRLGQRGVRRFLLEVLQSNGPAIRAYRAVGFEVTREFDCFELDLTASATWPLPARRADPDVTIGTATRQEVVVLAHEMDWQPSWENSLAAIQRIPDRVLVLRASRGDELLATLLYYPLLNWVMNLVVRRDARRSGIGSRLLTALRDPGNVAEESVKFINVASDDRGMIAFLVAHGCRRYVAQYEMEMWLA